FRTAVEREEGNDRRLRVRARHRYGGKGAGRRLSGQGNRHVQDGGLTDGSWRPNARLAARAGEWPLSPQGSEPSWRCVAGGHEDREEESRFLAVRAARRISEDGYGRNDARAAAPLIRRRRDGDRWIT